MLNYLLYVFLSVITVFVGALLSFYAAKKTGLKISGSDAAHTLYAAILILTGSVIGFLVTWLVSTI